MEAGWWIHGDTEKLIRNLVMCGYTTIWSQVQHWGAGFVKMDEQRKQQAQALPKRGSLIAGQVNRAKLGQEWMGRVVNIREEGWKELKVGCVFNIEPRPIFDGDTQEWNKAVNNDYIAHLGGSEYFGQLMWAQAQSRDWEAYYDTQIIGDGAVWIWNQAAEHFFDSHQTLDWYHALEHLHTAAHLYHPDDPEATRWLNTAETTLFSR